MWTYPEIDPVALSIGAFSIHWYGLMYLAGFAFFYFYGSWQAKKTDRWNSEMVSDFLFYGALGVILGARIGYVLFYNLAHYIENPMDFLKVWQGGMSLHGGVLGVTVGMFLYSRKVQMSILEVADFVVPLAPVGLFFGRIGNFINSELWGRVTDSPLGMKVYDAQLGQIVAKYPTQLLQAFLEGLVLFIILAIYSRKPKPLGAVAGLFLVMYGLFRSFVELYRQPDEQLGYLLFNWVTMGHLLSLPMILIGLGLMFYTRLERFKS